MSTRAPGIAESDLHAYVDGELEPGRAGEIETYLAGDPEAAARVAEWRRQGDLLRNAFAPVAAERVPERLRPEHLDTLPRAAPIEPAALASQRPRLAWAATIAFAAGLGVGALGAIGAMTGSAQPVRVIARGPDALAQQALAAHAVFTTDVRHPVEVAANEKAHLVQWLSRRLAYPLRIPDLRAEGYRLLGGRLLASRDGPAALLMFENAGGERVTLYCARPDGRETAFHYAEGEGSAAFYWSDRDAAYAVSGPADRDRLLRIARRVYEALEEPPGSPT